MAWAREREGVWSGRGELVRMEPFLAMTGGVAEKHQKRQAETCGKPAGCRREIERQRR
jgi:hypothetical protein